MKKIKEISKTDVVKVKGRTAKIKSQKEAIPAADDPEKDKSELSKDDDKEEPKIKNGYHTGKVKYGYAEQEGSKKPYTGKDEPQVDQDKTEKTKPGKRKAKP
jgi:hypothetical protein